MVVGVETLLAVADLIGRSLWTAAAAAGAGI